VPPADTRLRSRLGSEISSVFPPAAGVAHKLLAPLRFEVNTNRLPDAQVTPLMVLLSNVTRLSPPPATGTIKMSVMPLWLRG
jgi:hypothetical protein